MTPYHKANTEDGVTPSAIPVGPVFPAPVTLDEAGLESVKQAFVLVAPGREIMYDPFWPLRAVRALDVDPDSKMWPKQYGWGRG